MSKTEQGLFLIFTLLEKSMNRVTSVFSRAPKALK